MEDRRIIWKNKVGSTNQLLMEQQKSYPDGTVLAAKEQISGSGLGNNQWHSEPGTNLTFSYLFKPDKKTEASHQYLINMCVALSLQQFLSAHSKENVFIKWPNDIIINHQKICGILIQHTLMGSQIQSSVIGIGININQQSFPRFNLQATSLSLITGRTYKLKNMLKALIEILDNKLNGQAFFNVKALKAEFLQKLYRYNVWARYDIRGSEKTARIEGIDEFGFLQLSDNEGNNYVCDIKEVKYLY